ncbi:MAG: alcohol dehydrogenase catalytic domain-containing protein, partial [Myxococcales bacterium]|nr:alcohol dehydrogenase catalytic domain-containing protein [Myxococcales bacterium]
MKAAILTELNKDLEIRDDVELTEVGPEQVRIKLVSSGVCHSDLSAQNGTIPSGTPCVLGHEGAGTIQEVGEGVTDVVEGDHVILSFTPACRKCKACLRGQAALCETMISMATTPHFIVDGNLIGGFTGCGTFAEEMIVPENAVVKVDKDIPLNVVSLIGCGVTTGVGAAINTAAVKPGSSVAVIGCGYVGCGVGEALAGAGCDVVGTTTTPGRLDELRAVGIRPERVEVADLERLHTVLADREVVYLTIAPKSRSVDYGDVYRTAAVNVREAVEETAVRRIIYTSSTRVYGQDDGSWVNEASPTQPADANGR